MADSAIERSGGRSPGIRAAAAEEPVMIVRAANAEASGAWGRSLVAALNACPAASASPLLPPSGGDRSYAKAMRIRLFEFVLPSGPLKVRRAASGFFPSAETIARDGSAPAA